MNLSVPEKITKNHLVRNAYLYIRQSTIRQLVEHQESTKRQYALKQRAETLGWNKESIIVIDNDLGKSAAYKGRQGFERLVSEVGMGRAGIVLSLEISRLSRNNSDWHRLLEICALTDTLILDEDGIYNPAHFNDRLVLGLKGTMSEAELHGIRMRLIGGMENKALRGELKLRLPVGLIYNEKDAVVLDPDQQIQKSIKAFFDTFRREGTAFGSVRFFNKKGLLFPTRLHDGHCKGEVVWKPLGMSRANAVLHNPRYAGAFVYGRRTQKQKTISSTHAKTKFLKRSEWFSLVKDAHAGYISWEDYEENIKRLKKNRQWVMEDHRGAPREGPALLQGVVLCGVCGKRMSIRYYHRFGQLTPQYNCRGELDTTGSKSCQSIPGHSIDKIIGNLLLEKMNPAILDLALAVEKEVEMKISQIDEVRKKHIERLRYECELSRKRYMQADPENRLVVSTLESEWNEKLRNLNETYDDYEKRKKTEQEKLSKEIKDKIKELSLNFATVWNDPKTQHREKKRMVRLLIEDVTLYKGEKEIDIHVRFKGGKNQTLHIPRPQPIYEEKRNDQTVVTEIDRLLNDYTYSKVASILNEKGYVSGTGKIFDSLRVRKVRTAYRLKSRYQRLRDTGLMTTKEIAQNYGIHRNTVSKLRKKGELKGHLSDDQEQYLFEDPGNIVLLKNRKNVN